MSRSTKTFRFKMLAAAPLFAAAPVPVTAQTLEGEWTNDPALCGRMISANIHIHAEGYNFYETFCTFTGGEKKSLTNWAMKGTCGTEGNPDDPEMTMDLRVVGGALQVTEAGVSSSYAMKCRDKIDTSKP